MVYNKDYRQIINFNFIFFIMETTIKTKQGVNISIKNIKNINVNNNQPRTVMCIKADCNGMLKAGAIYHMESCSAYTATLKNGLPYMQSKPCVEIAEFDKTFPAEYFIEFEENSEIETFAAIRKEWPNKDFGEFQELYLNYLPTIKTMGKEVNLKNHIGLLEQLKEGDAITIGRGTDCNIAITYTDRRFSRIHYIIVKKNGKTFLRECSLAYENGEKTELIF